MPKDYYIQPDAPDPVLAEADVLRLVRQHLPAAQAVTAVDESGGEARMYAIDAQWVLKTQRPQQLRPRTSLKKEVFFLNQLQGVPGVSVPAVVGHGRAEPAVEYTLMTRMAGVAVKHANLQGAERRQALFDLGRMLRIIHSQPQAPFMESRLFPGDHSPVDVRQRFGNVFDEVLELIEQAERPWDFPVPALALARQALWALPDVDVWVALHSNPGPEHVFVDPVSRRLTGIIDFGDAYFGHPVNDLRRWRAPADRDAVFAGYIDRAPVNDNFARTWRVAQVLTDITVLGLGLGPQAESAAELQRVLAELG